MIENYGLFKIGMFTHVPFKAKIAKNTVSFWTERGQDWNSFYFPIITASNSVPLSIANEHLAKTPTELPDYKLVSVAIIRCMRYNSIITS